MKIKNINTLKRFSAIQNIKITIFFHYLSLWLKKKFDFKHFRLIIKRINTLLKTFRNNKFYRVNKLLSIDSNVPYFGSEIFFKYMDRFMNFDSKLSCSSVLLSITKECSFNCKHCYQKHDTGEDLDIEIISGIIPELKKSGITTFKIEGGDPFLKFERLERICKEIGFDGEIIINSSGNGITLERLKRLKELSNIKHIAISINSPIKEDVNFFMGQDYAWNTLHHGLKLCFLAEIPSTLNCCLHSGHYENGNFEYLMEIAKKLGVVQVMLIHPKAAGAWLQGQFPAFTDNEISHIKEMVRKYNRAGKFKKHPAVTSQIVEEDSDHYGCAGGGTDRFYINAKGDVQPCEFLNISFGNINDEEFSLIFNRMREKFNTPGTGWLCELYSDRVYNFFQSNNKLPLNRDKSELISRKWNRGDATPLYYKIEKELVGTKN